MIKDRTPVTFEVHEAQTVDSASIKAINRVTFVDRLHTYKHHPMALVEFLLVCLAILITVVVLGFLVGYVLIRGVPYLTPSLFAWQYNSDNVSMMPALINTLIITALSLVIAVPIGVFSAIYLVEYAPRGNKFVGFIRITAETLSGIPSIVYGLFGFLMFVIFLGWGYSILAGAFTLAIMILPLIMRTTEEAFKAVPDAFREGSFGLGAGRLRTIFKIILPSAAPGVLAGVILGIGRIVGETAALIYTAGTVTGVADSVMDSGRTLAIHMYALTSEGFHTGQAYATAVVLLIMVGIINGVSAMIAKKLTKSY
jgi:phosphate transport system permease protein